MNLPLQLALLQIFGFQWKTQNYINTLKSITSEQLFKPQKLTDSNFKKFLTNPKFSWNKVNETFLLYKEQGIRFTYLGCPNYPQAFYRLSSAPVLLSYKGHPTCWQQDRLSVVGSRSLSPTIRDWIELHFYDFLAENKLTTVSGGAIGADQLCHQNSLSLNLPTMVVLPCGLNNLYPQNLKNYITPILKSGGCFISEYSPNQQMLKYHFHQRNRLIAALSPLLFIIQAKRRSGSMITAKHAIEQNRSIAALPSSPTENNMGCLDLINDGAIMIRDKQDLNIAFYSANSSSKSESSLSEASSTVLSSKDSSLTSKSSSTSSSAF